MLLLPFLRSSATADEGTRRPSVPGADVAQLVEQLTRNEQVVRSSRIVGSIYVRGMLRDSGPAARVAPPNSSLCRLHVALHACQATVMLCLAVRAS